MQEMLSNPGGIALSWAVILGIASAILSVLIVLISYIWKTTLKATTSNMESITVSLNEISTKQSALALKMATLAQEVHNISKDLQATKNGLSRHTDQLSTNRSSVAKLEEWRKFTDMTLKRLEDKIIKKEENEKA